MDVDDLPIPRARRVKLKIDAPKAPGQSNDPYIPQKRTSGNHVENIWSIWFAARAGDAERVGALLKRGDADLVDRADEQHKRTALHWACKHGRTSVALMLLAHGANPNLKDEKGNTPLHYCCAFGSEAMLRILLNNMELDPTIQNNDHKTALQFGRSFAKPELVKILEVYCKSIGKDPAQSPLAHVTSEASIQSQAPEIKPDPAEVCVP